MAARAQRRRQTIFVGSKIRSLRKQRNLTQSALAQKIGVQQSDLCRMENGEYKVSLDTLFKILGVFGLNIGEFFRDESKPIPPGERESAVLTMFRQLDEDAQREVLEFVRFKVRRVSDTENSVGS
jgi:transcriptional regulator with XRE-family HTH domain